MLVSQILPVQASESLRSEVHELAVAAANAQPWASSRLQVAEKHPLQVQTLSIEKQEIKAEPDTPLLRVYQFNYQVQQARLVIVDSDNGSVAQIQAVNTVHLPLNTTEIAYASTLLAREEHIITSLRGEQSRRGHIPFKALSELDVKASIFEPVDNNHVCHRQRCALMSLFDDTSTVFSVEPIVNLQSNQVMLLHSP